MTDRDALLTAITANPDEDTPRLVYADWLQEHDEAERAEFIRLQCRLEHLSRHSAEGKRLAKREKELRAKLFGHLDALGFASITFRRGFVGQITSGLFALRDHLSKLRPEDAPAYELMIRWDDEEAAQYDDYDVKINVTSEVFAEETLRRCVALDLPCMGMWPSSYICESEHLINLRRFNFPDNEAGPHIESVASPTFANLRWANFHNSDSAADNPSIAPLAESPHLANLEYLDFGACEQWDGGLETVALSLHWNRLRYLDLSVSSFSTALNVLFQTRGLSALTELNLSDTFGSLGSASASETETTMKLLADSPLLARLSKLWLHGNSITDNGAKTLAASPRDLNLTLLDLSGNPIGAAGKRALRKRFGKDVCVFGKADE